KKPKPLPGFIVATVLLTLITIIGVGFVYFSVKDEIKTLKARKTANERRIKELKAKLKDLDRYEKLVKDVEAKKKLIIQLRKNQSVPVRVLDEISTDLPNGLWLTEMSFKGKTVVVTGYAFTNSDVVSYVNGLKKSKFFNGVYLAESKREVIKQRDIKEKIEAYKFNIRMNVVS
ncbi:MAG: hypothetical protein D6726_10825, partial [Nitrospirae bacterium]